jgi:hypothetical protein
LRIPKIVRPSASGTGAGGEFRKGVGGEFLKSRGDGRLIESATVPFATGLKQGLSPVFRQAREAVGGEFVFMPRLVV